jgi:hypothetical protein
MVAGLMVGAASRSKSARRDRGWNVGRRGHGEGSVYRRSRDGKWVGSVELGRGTGGERIRRTVVRASKRAVLDRLDELRRQAAQCIIDAPENLDVDGGRKGSHPQMSFSRRPYLIG